MACKKCCQTKTGPTNTWKSFESDTLPPPVTTGILGCSSEYDCTFNKKKKEDEQRKNSDNCNTGSELTSQYLAPKERE